MQAMAKPLQDFITFSLTMEHDNTPSARNTQRALLKLAAIVVHEQSVTEFLPLKCVDQFHDYLDHCHRDPWSPGRKSAREAIWASAEELACGSLRATIELVENLVGAGGHAVTTGLARDLTLNALVNIVQRARSVEVLLDQQPTAPIQPIVDSFNPPLHLEAYALNETCQRVRTIPSYPGLDRPGASKQGWDHGDPPKASLCEKKNPASGKESHMFFVCCGKHGWVYGPRFPI